VDSHDTLIAPQRTPARIPGEIRVGGRSRGGRGDGRAAGGSLLGRYRLLERLGAGGFGVVWRTHDELLDREVAVKVIPLPAGEDRERATREALACARLAHPAIVALYEARAEDDAFYLISELVHGQTLAQLIAREALRDEEVLEIGLALADALLHAHQRGVVHRDIKPQNVLVPDLVEEAAPSAPGGGAPAGSAAPAKLTDFGGALLAGEEGLTRTGDVLGTLAYMAPEQLEGMEVGESADLYSLALVLYEALSGINPVRGPTPAATARRIGCELAPLERHRRDLPRHLTRALDRALDPEPQERGTLTELRGSVSDALRERPGTQHGAQPDARGWLTPARLGWLGGTLAVCVWQLGGGRPGISLLALCAVLPLVLLVRRPGPWWLAAALAPLLGLEGLAWAFPAFAGQAARWRARALLGALGYLWLGLAEPLWGSPSNAVAVHSLSALVGMGLPLGLALWGFAATLLPWIVRGRSALADIAAAVLWAAALASAPLLAGSLAHRGLSISQAAPHDVLPGAALGAAVAVVARALRGPV
jgi:eukaryotic-like serine/threonine-protein kinase